LVSDFEPGIVMAFFVGVNGWRCRFGIRLCD
jgi:hypothetical protein